MNIFNTDIISSATDNFWQQNPPQLAGKVAAPVVVITQSYPENGAEDIQLQKILGACKLLPEHVNIIQLAPTESLAWHTIKAQLQPTVCILFGITPRQLAIAALMVPFTPNRFDDVIWVPATGLAQMEQDAESRKNLWLKGLKPTLADNIFGNLLAPVTQQ